MRKGGGWSKRSVRLGAKKQHPLNKWTSTLLGEEKGDGKDVSVTNLVRGALGGTKTARSHFKSRKLNSKKEKRKLRREL